MLTTITTLTGKNFNSTMGKYKVYVGGYTWFVDSAAEIQRCVDTVRAGIVGQTIKIWDNNSGKLLRTDIITKG